MARKTCLNFIVMMMTIMMTIVVVSSSSSSSSNTGRKRRSDDGGALEILVQQLSQQVNSLSSQLSAATARITSLEAKEAKIDSFVAFNAWNSVSPIHTVPNGILILNTASPNVGHAYDVTTGVFTAPVSGIYDFQISLLPNMAGDTRVFLGIFVDGSKKAESEADSRHGYWDHSTIRAIVHVTSGQKVMARSLENEAAQFYAYTYTTFSGYLIKAD